MKGDAAMVFRSDIKPKDEAVMVSGQPELVLDIGTHKVLALAVKPTETGVEVLASAFIRHQARAMRDGQVHDVEAVARTVRRAVDDVSQTVGVSFSAAHIAAAGRALKTSRGGSERSEPHQVLITPDIARSLEWEAVADAQLRLLESLPPQDHAKGFYCIAHTVVESRLDGEVIASLNGQRGKLFSIEVLATFLPGVVVDSLESVLAEAGLELHGLTLEPVAALEAIIPPTMRHLSLILVDIGAGTSDIALTGNGMVQAFAMVPRGGDAITEAVSRAFLLDFHVAEQVKQIVSSGTTATVENVLGDGVSVSPDDLKAAVGKTADLLADDIASAISEWILDTVPDALLLVGGGSNTPGLSSALAERVGLDESRIAVRDRRAVRDVFGEEQLSGPDSVTAMGIALRAARGKEMPPVRVRINGRPVSLFQPDRCTVREAARIAGVPLAQLVGRPGPGITITLNGVITALPGTRGGVAAVHVNGEPATLDSRLKNQDEVTLRLPSAGAPPQVTMADIARRWLDNSGLDRPRIQFNGVWRPVPLWIRRNDQRVRPDDIIADRDIITVRFVQTASELIAALDMPDIIDTSATANISDTADTPAERVAEVAASSDEESDGAAASPWAASAGAAASKDTALTTDQPRRWAVGSCTVNGRPVHLGNFATLWRNGVPARLNDPVRDGDVWEYRHQQPVTVGHVIRHLGLASERTMTIVLNGEPTSVSVPADIMLNGEPATPDTHVTDGDDIQVTTSDEVALYQILPHAGVSIESGTAYGRLVLLVGGQRAGFTTTVSEGDEVVIRYD